MVHHKLQGRWSPWTGISSDSWNITVVVTVIVVLVVVIVVAAVVVVVVVVVIVIVVVVFCFCCCCCCDMTNIKAYHKLVKQFINKPKFKERVNKSIYHYQQKLILISTMLQLTTCICSILAHHFYSNGMIHFNVMAFMRVAPGSTFHCNFWFPFDPRHMNKKRSIQNDKPVAFQAHLIHLAGKKKTQINFTTVVTKMSSTLFLSALYIFFTSLN